jgi:hypothetical protein
VAADDVVEEVAELDDGAATAPPSALSLDGEPGTEALIASGLEPWLCQLLHGYCPPANHRFSRHAPPTTFPGREDVPAPSPGIPGAVSTKMP